MVFLEVLVVVLDNLLLEVQQAAQPHQAKAILAALKMVTMVALAAAALVLSVKHQLERQKLVMVAMA
jgi:hypothetical protein